MQQEVNKAKIMACQDIEKEMKVVAKPNSTGGEP
jgi:hypothetical protein